MKTELPQYQCHKIVRAALIVAITHGLTATSAEGDDGETQFHDSTLSLSVPDDGEINNVMANVDAAWMAKHRPQEGGYFVQYDDGYSSFSPAAAFENGYTRVVPSTFRTRLLDEHASLQDRIEKLEQFVATPVFEGLSEIDRCDLRNQLIVMRDLEKILNRRVSRLCNNA